MRRGERPGRGPSAAATWIAAQGCESATWSSSSVGGIVGWTWDLDGTTASGEVATHRYEGRRDRNVPLAATDADSVADDADGATESATKVVDVP